MVNTLRAGDPTSLIPFTIYLTLIAIAINLMQRDFLGAEVFVSKEMTERNRGSLLRAASHLFRERGIDGVGVAEIAKEAGLTHGALLSISLPRRRLRQKLSIIQLPRRTPKRTLRTKIERLHSSSTSMPCSPQSAATISETDAR